MDTNSRAFEASRLPAEGSRRVFEDGVITGLVGAGLLALWFLVLDFGLGMPFRTPSLLGAVVFDGASVEGARFSVKNVFAYTGVHVLLFLVVGLCVALMFREFDENPDFGIAYLLVYVLFLIVLFGVEIAAFPEVLGVLGTWVVAGGNLVSGLGMLLFMHRRYPKSLGRLVAAWQA
jgi:hypothetical protein